MGDVSAQHDGWIGTSNLWGATLKLLPCKDEALLIWRNSFLVLNLVGHHFWDGTLHPQPNPNSSGQGEHLCFHIVNSVITLHFQCDCLPSECLHKDLHDVFFLLWVVELINQEVGGVRGWSWTTWWSWRWILIADKFFMAGLGRLGLTCLFNFFLLFFCPFAKFP